MLSLKEPDTRAVPGVFVVKQEVFLFDYSLGEEIKPNIPESQESS